MTRFQRLKRVELDGAAKFLKAYWEISKNIKLGNKNKHTGHTAHTIYKCAALESKVI